LDPAICSWLLPTLRLFYRDKSIARCAPLRGVIFRVLYPPNLEQPLAELPALLSEFGPQFFPCQFFVFCVFFVVGFVVCFAKFFDPCPVTRPNLKISAPKDHGECIPGRVRFFLKSIKGTKKNIKI